MPEKRKPDAVIEKEAVLIPVLTPSLAVITDGHADLLKHPVPSYNSRNSEYELVELDKEGIEVLGSNFTVGETTFRTSFANNPNFKVKKNPK